MLFIAGPPFPRHQNQRNPAQEDLCPTNPDDRDKRKGCKATFTDRWPWIILAGCCCSSNFLFDEEDELGFGPLHFEEDDELGFGPLQRTGDGRDSRKGCRATFADRCGGVTGLLSGDEFMQLQSG